MRFAFPEEAIWAFESSKAQLVVDNPGECARSRLSAETKAALLEDLGA